MSVTAQASLRRRDNGPWYLHALYLLLFSAWAPVLASFVVANRDRISDELPDLALWSLVALVVNLLPLKGWTSAPFVADLPIIAAIALIFPPPEVALIAFVSSFELPGSKRPVSNLLWNHSQMSLSMYVGSTAAHLIHPGGNSSPLFLLAAFAGLTANYLTNYLLVGLSLTVRFHEPLLKTMSKLTIGTGPDYALAFLAGGSVGALVASVYGMGLWVLPAFLSIVLWARQAILRSQMYATRDRDYRSREKALADMAEQVDRERADERRLIAADLHDEVLPSLVHVSLLSQVVRKKLESGRMETVHSDVPQVVYAATTAAEQLRSIVGDLRRPGLGKKGLTSVLRNLVSLSDHNGTVTVNLELVEVDISSTRQLALYHIAKEAISNAIRHAGPSVVHVELSQDDHATRLEVSDDGKGFDPLIPRDFHYGLDIMKERAAAVGGTLQIDSRPGGGTVITASIPVEPDYPPEYVKTRPTEPSSSLRRPGGRR